MIPNGEKLHYLAVKKLSVLLRLTTSKHHEDFYCFNCLRYFATEKNLKSPKKVCQNKGFCKVIMPYQDIKVLEFNQNQKSDKAPFIIYANLACVIEKIDWCKNNPENSFATKVSKNISSGFSMSTISSFRSIEDKYDVYRGKDCMEKFCELLEKQAMKIINFKERKMKLLTKQQLESYENAKICDICKDNWKLIFER